MIIFATMEEKDDHIKVLKELATLDPGTFMLGKGQYHVKISANDIIQAGKRLEELGIFNFEKKEETLTITVEYIEPIKEEKKSKKSITKSKK